MAGNNLLAILFSKVSHMRLKALPSSNLQERLSALPGWAFLAASVPDALQAHLDDAVQAEACLPHPDRWFHALESVGAPQDVRVVILGQDPYHGPGQAQGLAFSVPEGWPLPPSLRNIYKEIARDLGGTPPVSGELSGWAQQGVLLLNDVLTVAPGAPGSHQGFGWQHVTAAALSSLTDRPVAFMLWGRRACAHAERIRTLHPGHHILETVHPSPLSAHRGFIGCGHFGAVNRWLVERREAPIAWFDSPW